MRPAVGLALAVVAGVSTACGSADGESATGTGVSATTGGAGGSVGRTTISIGDAERGSGLMALDSRTRTLYVVDSVPAQTGTGGRENAVLSIVDLAAETVIASIPLPAVPRDIAVDSAAHTLYAVSSPGGYEQLESGTVTVVDTDAKTITATIPTGKNSWQVEVDENTHTAYVLNCVRNCLAMDVSSEEPSTLTVIAPGDVAAGTPVPFGDYASGFVLDADRQRAYVTTAAKRIDVIDLATLAKVAETPVPHWASDISFDRAGRTLFTGYWRWKELDLIEVDTSAVRSIDRPGCTDPSIVQTMDSSAHTLYATCPAADTVAVIDTRTGAVTGTVNIRSPEAVAVDPDTHTLYVYGAGEVSVISR
ncbi:YncE family protein [Nocardia huaxiensis]|uniref:YncE family protein n=1 Tax=Nocardia huaxiensis TaxID=2755382 RepID=UPI001E41499A|nr:YncE family protein [Nocardia huaxiensis]UFS94140.1 YncE family protein [Nocardia huaxiensis]